MNFENIDNIYEESSMTDILLFAESYGNAVTREYEINKEEASLLLMESVIDSDTYLYMMEENSRIFCEKMDKKAETLSEKMKKSMENFKKKLFGKASAEAQMSKMEKFKKFLKMNPDVANKKVKFTDNSKRLEDIRKQKKGLLELAAKQKASGKYDKEPIIKYGKRWEEYKRQQERQKLKKDVTVMVACSLGIEVMNRAFAWINNRNASLENEYNQIMNPPPEPGVNLKSLYCSMRDLVDSQWNSLNQEEQILIFQTQQELESMYSRFAPDLGQSGLDYQQVVNDNMQANGWI